VNKPRVQGARTAAQRLLETTGHPVERIAGEVGFGSPTSFRDLFKRIVGTNPRDYRRAFRGSPAR
jgi:transcriptional regulator GlxA family with amidase domain